MQSSRYVVASKGYSDIHCSSLVVWLQRHRVRQLDRPWIHGLFKITGSSVERCGVAGHVGSGHGERTSNRKQTNLVHMFLNLHLLPIHCIPNSTSTKQLPGKHGPFCRPKVSLFEPMHEAPNRLEAPHPASRSNSCRLLS